MEERQDNIFKDKLKGFIPVIVLFILMFLIHRYIFLYGDDFYYSRDAKKGIGYLPELMGIELRSNGRLWVHFLMTLTLSNDIFIFRIINPIIIAFSAYIIGKVAIYSCGDVNIRKRYWAYIIASLFFLILPTRIVYVSIYYAATAFNYFYPSIVTLIFGVLIYKYFDLKDRSFFNQKYSFLLLLFLSLAVGSSTQQCAMMGLGFLVVSFIYRIREKKFISKYIALFTVWIIGFIPISYGTILRYISERKEKSESNVLNTLEFIFKTNLFRLDIYFILLLVILSIFAYFSYVKRHYSSNQRLLRVNDIFLRVAAVNFLLLSILHIFNLYVPRYFGVFEIIFMIFFSICHISLLLYVGWLCLRFEGTPFILNIILNALGSLFMIIVADKIYAKSYKVAFPSLIFIFTFVIHNILLGIKDDKNKKGNFIIKFFTIILFLSSLFNYVVNYIGYREIAPFIKENAEIMEEYAREYRSNKIGDEVGGKNIVINYVPERDYGYFLSIWNELPPQLNLYYGIPVDTKLRHSYIKSVFYYIRIFNRAAPLLKFKYPSGIIE